MNAYELADDVKNISNTIEALEWVQKATPLLRQQADRIAELEKVSKPVAWMDYLEHSNVYDLNVSGRGIPLYTTPQIKELSDEEILNIAFCSEIDTVAIENDWNGTVLQFARAILRKAQEK